MAVKLGSDETPSIMIDGENLNLAFDMRSRCEDAATGELTMPLTALLTLTPLANGCGTSLMLCGQGADGESYLETRAVRSKIIGRSVIHDILGRDGGINSRLALRVAFGGLQAVKELRSALIERFKSKLVDDCEILAACAWLGGRLEVDITIRRFGDEKERMFFFIPYESSLHVLKDRRRK